MIHSTDKATKNNGSIAAAIPFPPISWWLAAMNNGTNVYLDPNEHYQKMTYRNRYYLASKQQKQLLSIPLSKGRNQHIAMQDIEISYAEDWQKNHWRTLQTLLGNSPFFEYIDYQLFPFFNQEYTHLYHWNKKSIEWANHFMGNPLNILALEDAIEPSSLIDLKHDIHPKNEHVPVGEYYQVFKKEIGFIADCSILDLICCEGKNALNILMEMSRK